MKIALISLHFAEYAFCLAQALTEKHDVLLCINEKNFTNEVSAAAQMASNRRCTIVRLPDVWLRRPLLFFKGIRVLMTEIRRFRPGVIHCQEAVRDYLMAALLLLPHYPLVLTIHDHVPHTGQDSKMNRRTAFYRSYLRQRADLAIVHGDRIRRQCEDDMPWLRGKVFSIPHGTLGETTTCSATHWNNGTILFFGRVEEYKGLRYLIESVHLLKTEGFDVKVIIAGTGSDLTSYRDYLKANASFELIDRYIKKEEIPEIFARVDIVVMPYTDATQSGVAALALNYKCPVIATNVGSIEEMVRDGINGLLVPARDAQALADAIRSLLLDQAKLARMSANAGHLAAGEFSWRSIGESTQKIYEAAIQHATKT